MIDDAAVRAVLAKLRVRSGLRGEVRDLDATWRIGLWHGSPSAAGFLATLYHNPSGRQSTMALTSADVETRGRSQWMANNTWRLTAEGIDRVAASIANVTSDPRARCPRSE
jgi:hypothetical protein